MASFRERQKNLFQHLKDAEEQYNFSTSNNLVPSDNYGAFDRHAYKKLRREVKEFRGRAISIYKRPEANIHDCLQAKTTPDFIKNPGKWKYYSLSDVTPDQMSDKTNIQTALAFIREMEESANKVEEDNMVIDETGAVFKKPSFNISKTIKQPAIEEPQPVLQSNKVIMPEYVVGMSAKKNNANRINKRLKKNVEAKQVELKLNHLYEDNDDDETT
ncbi:U5 small nuclear ribonucleoprotein TSSC4 [Vanessa tameamea]|uniref:U5 small nuclear ribonucleoprotein TSSC4 n=1 Tax=Vanessa tameamea TaxID=334116 RepID=A0A8B8IU99_VANTA